MFAFYKLLPLTFGHLENLETSFTVRGEGHVVSGCERRLCFIFWVIGERHRISRETIHQPDVPRALNFCAVENPVLVV